MKSNLKKKKWIKPIINTISDKKIKGGGGTASESYTWSSGVTSS